MTLDRRVCVAPMMDYTDRHCRYLLRLLSQPRVKARVGLRAVKELPECRKELARQLQAEVTQLGKPE